MAPDSDVKDRIDRPGQNIVLDAGYSTVYVGPAAEDESDDDEEEDGEGRASFALDTPEPAIPHRKAKGGKRKAGKNSKSVLGARFAERAPVMADAAAPGAAMAIDINEKIFRAGDAPENYLSAFDRDEVTDTPTDLMNILFSAGDRPWENESLSAAERMAMMKVLRTNFPDAQKRAEREEFEFRIRARTSSGRTANVAAIVAAVAKSQPQHAPEIQKPTLKTVQKTEASTGPEPLRLVTPREPFIREYGREEEIYRVDRNLNAALGIGSIVGMPSSLAMLNMKAKPEANQAPVNYLGLAEIVASQMPVQPELRPETRNEVQERVTWIPNILSRDTGFVQALKMLYEAILPETLGAATPYREAVWKDKVLEQKENLADITFRSPQVLPALSIYPRYEMNIGVPALK